MERVNKEALHLNHNKQNNRFKTGCLSRVEGAQDEISRGNTGYRLCLLPTHGYPWFSAP